MARLIDQEYDSAGNIIEVTIEDDGSICGFERVRHGRWIQSKTVPSYHYCSRCRVPQKMEKSCNKYVFIHYCPYCGAKMDGENE